MTLKNKNVLITGGSKGIGRRLALDLAKMEANVGVVARSGDELESLKKEIETMNGNCLIFKGSVADEAFANQTVADFIEEFGGVDFMINNAGYGIFGQVETISADDWSDLFDTNVKGTFLFSKAVLAMMKKQQSGHIINIASDVAKRVFDGGGLYCASKFAQDAFSAALRKEVRKDGIKVSVVYSGLVDSSFHAEPAGDESHADWLKSEDMSDAIVYIMNTPKHVVIDEFMIHPLSQDY